MAFLVLPTALFPGCCLVRCLVVVSSLVASLWLLPFGFYLTSSPVPLPPLLSQPPVFIQGPHGFWATCMNAGALLAESIRVAISGLRAVASALEEALARFDSVHHESFVDCESPDVRPRPSSAPLAAPSSSADWGIVTSAAVSEHPNNTPPLVGLGPLSAGASSIAGTDFSTESYHQVAATLDPLPGYCLDFCLRLGGTKNQIEYRAKRAWEAGLWARATLQGLVPKPRPSPKLPGPKNSVYIIVRAPTVLAPTRVDTAAEYFRLIPSFSGSNSISHAFGSVAEARVYCAGVGIPLPDPQ